MTARIEPDHGGAFENNRLDEFFLGSLANDAQALAYHALIIGKHAATLSVKPEGYARKAIEQMERATVSMQLALSAIEIAKKKIGETAL